MTFKVGSFNLFQFCAPPYSYYIKKDKFTKEQWENKLSWIKEQIKKSNCDIIGFQEVFSSKELEALVKELGFKYFETVDSPKVDKNNQLIYITTTVALASKFPIKKLYKIKPNGYALKKLDFQGGFRFSRTPIKALIELPNGLDITFYVNHFKSNRLNEFEYIFKKETTLKEKKQQVKSALENNYSMALKQRLAETSSLYFDFKKCKTPMICVCDLNDKEFSLSIEALTNKAYHEKRDKDFYLLYDAYQICDKKVYNPHPEKKEIKRTPTSYYQGYGNVIDYIFVSKEFNKKNEPYMGEVVSYEVLDEHLKENKDGSLLQSDHAMITCEIKIL